MQSLKFAFLLGCFIFLSDSTFSQSISIPKDSSALQAKSTEGILPADSVPSTAPKTSAAVETTIKYKAKDSIFFDVNKRQVKMYGESKIIYGSTELEAAETQIDWESNTISANGVQDTTGKKIGVPVFIDDGQTYVTQDMKYNFKTKKAYISGVVTQQGEAFMHGEKIKKNEFNEMFVNSAKYTTCNLEKPHFHIASSKIKLIPNDKIVAGPFHLRVNDIPTPLGFAFGMFPLPRKRASGIIFPTYGEERRRGFFLRDGGYYLALNDYITVAVLGEVYSKGSNGLSVKTDYRKRYAYNGNFNFRYNKQRISENIEDTLVQKDYWIQWSHSPVSKGLSRFSASVNAGTSSFNVNNPSDVARNINQTFNSSISYSTSFPGTPFNLSSSLRHTQNVRTNAVSMSFPEVALNMNRIYPFKFKGSSGKAWYEKINLAYNSNFTNQIANRPLKRVDGTDSTYYEPFNQETIPTLIRNGRNGVRHTVPISTSFNLFKHFTVSPNFNYNEIWYFKSLDWNLNPETNLIEADTIQGFSRAGNYNFGAGINTRMYGILNFKSERIKAIRHTFIPSVSYSYNPDYTDPSYGVYKYVQDSLGREVLTNKYQGFVYGTLPQGQSSSISFSLSNNLEMKVHNPKDTSRTDKKVAIFENLSVTGSYNMLADSFKLSDLRLAARTRIFDNKFDVNFSMLFDPYVWRTDSTFMNTRGEEQILERRLNEFAWQNGQGVGRLKSVDLSVSTNFNPKAREAEAKNPNTMRGMDGNPLPPGSIDPATGLPVEMNNFSNDMSPEMAHLYTNPNEYVDFNIPWSLRVMYNIRWNRSQSSGTATTLEPNITQTIRTSGDVNITDKWKIGFSTGWDFTKKEITQTDIRIFRDLHCWEMNLNWTPFGRFTSYSMDIRVKASVLRDLKYNRRRSFWDN
ncbi:putative LPS assembly protein LptD [Cytophagales bacterium LB-30]|uniref:LPS assembly protein LptD n=1 Tax=Shiella aurantiaca TaxID=3058365 RepID=A0ABT8F7Q1_9BACT|nr:putative LPS assembly protein LptD [Shiella aurantiaca]MDN4166507.1 putative LPS assembly protein LptD [Shiella aurantiaca]